MSLTLNITKELPLWITGSTSRTIVEILTKCLAAADVKGSVQVQFSHEQNVLKGRPPARSVEYHASHRSNTKQSIYVVVAGREPRNDQTGAVLSLPAAEITKLRQWFTNEPLWEMPAPPKGQPQLNAAPAPALDEESAALFLDGLKEFGSTVTRGTANAVAARLFGGDSGIVADVIIAGLLAVKDDVCSLTPKGSELVKKTLAVPEAPPPSTFEILRARVQDFRRRLEEAKSGHGATAGERARLTNLVAESTRMEKSSAKNLETARSALERAEQNYASVRTELLRLETQLRELPPDRSAEIAVLQKDLAAAEAEYRKFVEL